MRASHLLLACLLVHAIAFAISARERALPAADFDRYYEIGSSAGRPYVDDQVEHPIATLLVFKALARLPGGRPAFGLGVVVLDQIMWSAYGGVITGDWPALLSVVLRNARLGTLCVSAILRLARLPAPGAT